MATYIKDGRRITMTAKELSDWNAYVAKRKPQPARQKSKQEKLSDLLIAKGILTKAEVDNI